MRLDLRTTALAAALLLTTGSAAHALLLTEKSPAQKLRADVGKQITGYLKCLGKAVVACEKTGAATDAECVLETGATTAPADPKAKFATAVGKCDSALDFARKAPPDLTSFESYELLGCPNYGIGFLFSGLEQYEQFLLLVKPALDDLIDEMPFMSGCSDAKSCANAAKVLLNLIDGLNRCDLACEEDYKGKKGNGGPTDDLAQCDATGDPKAQACNAKVAGKFLKSAEDWPLRDLVIPQIAPMFDGFNDRLWNIADNCP
jgi:hypothetical protein